MKDIERAIIKLKKSIYEPQEQGDSPHKTVVNVGIVFDKIDKWHEKLQSELDRQEGKALELSELKKMVGKPVWDDDEKSYVLIYAIEQRYSGVNVIDYIEYVLPNRESRRCKLENCVFYKFEKNGEK